MSGWVVGGAILGSAAIGGIASNQAAKTEVGAANNATALQGQEFNTLQNEYAPYRAAGTQDLGQIQTGLQPGGQFSGTFTPQDFMNNMDPAYGFMQQQGQQAVERSGAAQGLDLSGSTLKGLTQYSQGLASNEYNNAYNRYMQSRNQNYAELSGVVNNGLGATNSGGQLGTSLVNQMGSNMIGAGNAAAAGQMGVANAFSGALGSAANYAGQYGMLGALGLLKPNT